jgi:uncharacterized protein (TIGR00369 family)
MMTPHDNLFFGIHVPFLSFLDMQAVHLGNGQSEIAIEMREELANHFHSLHGGVIATLLDVAMATAGRSLNPDLGVATVSMTTNFLSSPKEGRIVARGRIQKAGRNMVFCEGEVVDATGTLVATGIGTFLVRRGKSTVDANPASSRSAPADA